MKTDNEILAMTRRLLNNSIGSVGSDTRFDTTALLDQYHGRPYGTEVPGRSKIVTRDVLEQIEWAMPSLLRVFGSGERVVMFTPTGPEDVEQAEQETDYVNYVFAKDSAGWYVLNEWMRSALLERNAYVKVYWDTQRHTRVTTYEGLTGMQLEAVMSGADAQIPTGYEFEAVEVIEQEAMMALDPMTGEQVEAFDVKVREVATRGIARVVYVPREEMRISKDARDLCLDDVTMTAHVRDVMRSDLLEMGYDPDVVERLPSDRSTDLASNTVQYARQTERSTQRTEYQAPDNASELVQIEECYVRLDVDEDGISELRKVVIAGETVLEADEVEDQPFVALCPIPQPAAHIGLGLGDLVEDIQLVKTHLLRSILDNLALSNNPEKEVKWDDILFKDDMTTSVVGGLKRVAEMGAIREITVPFTAGASVPIMELLDGMKEARTGISRNTMGLDADTLAQSTMGAFQMGLDQANQRLEMIARTFAETGVSWMFVKLRALIMRHQDIPRMVNLRGKFVPVDPRDWEDRTDVTATVGLGTGRTGQTLGQLQAVAQKQEEHMQQDSPLVDFQNLYHTYGLMIEAAGWKDPSAFFADPDSPEFEQKTRAKAEAAQAEQQKAEQTQAAQLQLLQQQVQVAMADVEAKNSKTQADMVTAAQKTQSDAQATLAKVGEDFQKFLEENRRKWAELELKHGVDVPGEGVGPGVVSGSETVQ